MLPNIVWDGVKMIGGYAVIKPVANAIHNEYLRSPTDWWAFFAWMFCGVVLLSLAYWLQRYRNGHARLDTSQCEDAQLKVKPRAPTPQELKDDVLQIAGDLCAFLMESGAEIEQVRVDLGSDGLGDVPDDPEIRDGFPQRFQARLAAIKNRLGAQNLLAERFTSTSIGDALASDVRNVGDVCKMIRALDSAKTALDEKCIKGIPFAFADSPKKRLAIGAKHEEIFSSLQLEAFQLAKDMRGFLIGLGPKPLPMRGGGVWAHDGSLEWMLERNKIQDPWNQRLIHGYANIFARRVEHAMHSLAQEGLDANRLKPCTGAIVEEKNVTDAACLLDQLAIEFNCRKGQR